MSSGRRLLVLVAAASGAAYAALALAGDLTRRPLLHLGARALLFALYVGAIAITARARERWGAAPILWWALAFRLILLPTSPSLSDDVYRYVWEGRLHWLGFNPYAVSPDDPALAPWRDHVYEKINNKDLPAIYPPVMQWAGALAALHPSVASMKALFVAADMVAILLLCRLLAARGRPPGHAVIYAWNPLVVVEVAASGHNDPLAVMFLLAATVGIIGERRVLSTAALALSALSKLFPLALAPFFLRRAGAALLLLPVMLAAGYLPYLDAGAGLLRSPREYAERWRFNDSLFGLIERAVDAAGLPSVARRATDALGLDILYAMPHMLARGIAALVAACALAWIARRAWRGAVAIDRAIALFTGTVLVLMPVMHPWYLLWILPWMAVEPVPAWIALTGLAPLASLDAAWARWAVYLPFYALLAGRPLWRALRGRVVEWAGRGGS
jgi:hypothetical protein